MGRSHTQASYQKETLSVGDIPLQHLAAISELQERQHNHFITFLEIHW